MHHSSGEKKSTFSFFKDKVLLYRPGWPGTHHIDQAILKHKDLPASGSWVLWLKTCTPYQPWKSSCKAVWKCPERVHVWLQWKACVRNAHSSRFDPSTETKQHSMCFFPICYSMSFICPLKMFHKVLSSSFAVMEILFCPPFNHSLIYPCTRQGEGWRGISITVDRPVFQNLD